MFADSTRVFLNIVLIITLVVDVLIDSLAGHSGMCEYLLSVLS